MRRINPSLNDSVAVLARIGAHLDEPYRTFYMAKESELKRLYRKYDTKMHVNALEDFYNSIFEPTDTINIKGTNHMCWSLMYNIFDNHRYTEIAEHYESVKENNGGEELICPICELETAKELDHYIPRNQNCCPEFSVHVHNLIPLCHECNDNKKAVWLKEGKRVIFNAYVDNVPTYNLFICKIRTRDGWGLIMEMPHVTIDISPELQQGTSENEERIRNTIIQTKLLEYDRYPIKIKTRFANELNKIIKRYKNKKAKMSASMFWAEEVAQYQSYLQPPVSNDILDTALYTALARDEQDVRDWFVTKLPSM